MQPTTLNQTHRHPSTTNNPITAYGRANLLHHTNNGKVATIAQTSNAYRLSLSTQYMAGIVNVPARANGNLIQNSVSGRNSAYIQTIRNSCITPSSKNFTNNPSSTHKQGTPRFQKRRYAAKSVRNDKIRTFFNLTPHCCCIAYDTPKTYNPHIFSSVLASCVFPLLV